MPSDPSGPTWLCSLAQQSLLWGCSPAGFRISRGCAAAMTVAPGQHIRIALVVPPRPQSFHVASPVMRPWVHRPGNGGCSQAPGALLHCRELSGWGGSPLWEAALQTLGRRAQSRPLHICGFASASCRPQQTPQSHGQSTSRQSHGAELGQDLRGPKQ